jgi:hypothetical protein
VRFLAILLLALTISSGSVAQASTEDIRFGISASLGIDALSTPSIAEYLSVVAGPGERIDEFTSAIEFAVAPEVRLSRSWSAAVEYVYLTKTYSLQGSGGGSTVSLGVHLPFLLIHYVIPSERTRIKLGGGAGPAFGTLDTQLFGSLVTRTFRARGGGVKLEAVGNTKFDDHLYGVMSIDLRWVLGGTYKEGTAEARLADAVADLNYFSLGLKFGIEFTW